MERRKTKQKGSKVQQIEVRDKDNTLAFPPYYEWLTLNEAARTRQRTKTRAAYNRIFYFVLPFHTPPSRLSHCYSMILRALCSFAGGAGKE